VTRVTSADFLREAYSEETGITIIMLITIDHADLDSPLYISTDPTTRLSATTTEIVYGTTSNGTDYTFLPVRLTLPSEDDEGPGGMRIEMDNIHQDLVPTIRNLTSPPTFNVDIVTSDDVDAILASWPEYLLTNAQYNEQVITGELTLELLYSEPFPGGTFTPSEFPGLF